METVKNLEQTSLAFINDKSSLIDLTHNDLVALGADVLFRSENIEDGLSKLSTLRELPEICIIDLDFYDRNVLEQLRELKVKYPSIKLIAHSDIDDNETVKTLSEIGFASYLLIGSDADGFRKAIDKAVNG